MSHEELGGAHIHTTTSGVAHKSFENDVETLLQLREFLGYLPQSNRQEAPIRVCDDPWLVLVLYCKKVIQFYLVSVTMMYLSWTTSSL